MTAAPAQAESITITGRLFAVLISAIFAAAFGGFGIYMGLWPLLQNANAAWQARQWRAP